MSDLHTLLSDGTSNFTFLPTPEEFDAIMAQADEREQAIRFNDSDAESYPGQKLAEELEQKRVYMEQRERLVRLRKTEELVKKLKSNKFVFTPGGLPLEDDSDPAPGPEGSRTEHQENKGKKRED